MRLSRGKKVEITNQLTPPSAERLAQWIGCFGVVWNCKVAEDERAFQEWNASGRSQESRPKANQAASHFVDESRPWLGEVPSQIRRNAAAKWFEAKQAALKGLRRNPRFRRTFGKKSCVVTSELFEARVAEGKIFLAFKASTASAPFCSVAVVPAHHSSQECARCGFIDAGNRTTQAAFACLSCGHAENADVNAAKVLKNRFLTELRNGTLLPKSKAIKKIAVRRQPRGDPPREARCEPVEPDVRPGSDSRQGRRSRKGPSAREACSG